MSTAYRRASTAVPAPTLAELMDVVARQLAPPLIQLPWPTRLREQAASLPFTDLAGFEARLGSEDPQVDLIVRLPNGAVEIPAAADPSVWDQVLDLCAQRDTPGTVLNRAVNVIDLEFDLPASHDPAYPAVFFELERFSEPDAERLAALAAAAVGAPIGEPLTRRLAAITDLLPPGSRVIHLGAMLSRPGSPLRVVASRLLPDALAAVASRLCDVPQDRIDAALSEIVDRVDSVSVSFDVADAPTGRVSFEGFVAAGPQRRVRFAALIDDLVDRGRCTPEQRDALVAWPGVVGPDGCDAWPEALRRGDALLGGYAASVVARFLSHVKWGVYADGTVSTKVYFGMSHWWRTPWQPDVR